MIKIINEDNTYQGLDITPFKPITDDDWRNNFKSMDVLEDGSQPLFYEDSNRVIGIGDIEFYGTGIVVYFHTDYKGGPYFNSTGIKECNLETALKLGKEIIKSSDIVEFVEINGFDISYN